MTDQSQERVELPGVLEHILRSCLKDAQTTMEAGEDVVPFSALAAGQTLFCEKHAFNTPDQCFADVKHTVEHARGSQGYGFCYDGYLDTSEGRKDALIAQGGVPGDAQGYAIGLLYTINGDGTFTFKEEPIYVGPCENFMANLLPEEDETESSTEAETAAAEGEAAEGEAAGVPEIEFNREDSVQPEGFSGATVVYLDDTEEE